MRNVILSTDSYKLTHWNMYPEGTEAVYSYFESRKGARFPETVFFGLQPLLFMLADDVVWEEEVEEAALLAANHFGRDDIFNREGWLYIANELNGKLPLRIKAVPEGTAVPTGNVLMTVENTDPKCWWLTNALESYLTHVWYASTVASLSRYAKQRIKHYLDLSADSDAGLPFMLHDFGYRGVSSEQSAEMGGMAHLVNFMGTDTLPAMLAARAYYRADLSSLAFSVPATEHSVMTSLGAEGEKEMLRRALEIHPTGVLSVVSDSYNIYNFVTQFVGRDFRQQIMDRDGVFVVRPDSVTQAHPTPEDETVWILRQLAADFGTTRNDKGFEVLNPKVRVLWGDGLDIDGIESVLRAVTAARFSAENMVFGMGGGLLQKVNRDTQRFAFKCSAQKQHGEWHDVYKNPLTAAGFDKSSKKGRLSLLKKNNEFITCEGDFWPGNLLETVFENGDIVRRQDFDDIRRRAAL